MRISDWSSDVCSSDRGSRSKCSWYTWVDADAAWKTPRQRGAVLRRFFPVGGGQRHPAHRSRTDRAGLRQHAVERSVRSVPRGRSEEHTSELQSLMRISYAVFCLKKKTNKH